MTAPQTSGMTAPQPTKPRPRAPSHDVSPATEIDPVSSTAGQDQGADVPHQPTAAEGIGVIGAGNAAPHVRSGEQRSIGQHHRDAGKGVEILCIADKQSGDVSQTVAWPGLDQDG